MKRILACALVGFAIALPARAALFLLGVDDPNLPALPQDVVLPESEGLVGSRAGPHHEFEQRAHVRGDGIQQFPDLVLLEPDVGAVSFFQPETDAEQDISSDQSQVRRVGQGVAHALKVLDDRGLAAWLSLAGDFAAQPLVLIAVPILEGDLMDRHVPKELAESRHRVDLALIRGFFQADFRVHR